MVKDILCFATNNQSFYGRTGVSICQVIENWKLAEQTTYGKRTGDYTDGEKKEAENAFGESG